MPKFEKQFVHFMWSDELKGKTVFYADDIHTLIKDVKSGYDIAIVEESGSIDNPFEVNYDCWKFVYFDPYYGLKRAHEQGKVIQHFDVCNDVWVDATYELDWTDSVECYRVKTASASASEERLVTKRELAQWLAEGYGQFTYMSGDAAAYHYGYIRSEGSTPVDEDIRVRLWGDTEWHMPTHKYMYSEE